MEFELLSPDGKLAAKVGQDDGQLSISIAPGDPQPLGGSEPVWSRREPGLLFFRDGSQLHLWKKGEVLVKSLAIVPIAGSSLSIVPGEGGCANYAHLVDNTFVMVAREGADGLVVRPFIQGRNSSGGTDRWYRRYWRGVTLEVRGRWGFVVEEVKETVRAITN